MTRKAQSTLLGSSPTLAAAHDLIKRFYGGESKELRTLDADTWTVHRANGDRIASVIVRFKNGRYRFEREGGARV